MEAFLKALGELNPLFQFLTLVAIMVYVWKTWAMADATRKAAEASELSLKEMKAAREEQVKPYVICYFTRNKVHSFYDLIICNSGESMAFNVRIAFNPPLEHYNASLNKYDLPEKTFASLAPKQEWRTFWGSFIEEAHIKYPEKLSASVSFQWGPSRKHESYEITFDAGSLSSSLHVHETSTEDSLEKMEKSLADIAEHLKRGS